MLAILSSRADASNCTRSACRLAHASLTLTGQAALLESSRGTLNALFVHYKVESETATHWSPPTYRPPPHAAALAMSVPAAVQSYLGTVGRAYKARDRNPKQLADAVRLDESSHYALQSALQQVGDAAVLSESTGLI